MVSKKRRQQDPCQGTSDEGIESGEDASKESECQHVTKGVDMSRLRKAVNDNKFQLQCFYCMKDRKPNENGNVDPDRLFICLQCGNAFCEIDQREHVIKHLKSTSDLHCILLDSHQWRVYCYKCDNTLENSCKIVQKKKKIQDVTEFLKKARSKSPVKTNKQETNNHAKKITKMKQVNEHLSVPKGLANMGNTCFFNSVLQCLAQTPYLIKVLDELQVSGQTFTLEGGKWTSNNNEEIIVDPIEGVLESLEEMTPALRRTLSEMTESKNSHNVFQPRELYDTLKNKSGHCTDGDQHDSHELLRHLLEAVRSEDIKRYQTIILEKFDVKNSKPQKVPDDVKAKVKLYGKQINEKLLGSERVFRGELVSTVECLVCHNKSSRKEPFLDLSLPVPTESFLSRLKPYNNDEDSISIRSDTTFIHNNDHIYRKERRRQLESNPKSELYNLNLEPSNSGDEKSNSEITNGVPKESSITHKLENNSQNNSTEVDKNSESEDPLLNGMHELLKPDTKNRWRVPIENNTINNLGDNSENSRNGLDKNSDENEGELAGNKNTLQNESTKINHSNSIDSVLEKSSINNNIRNTDLSPNQTDEYSFIEDCERLRNSPVLCNKDIEKKDDSIDSGEESDADIEDNTEISSGSEISHKPNSDANSRLFFNSFSKSFTENLEQPVPTESESYNDQLSPQSCVSNSCRDFTKISKKQLDSSDDEVIDHMNSYPIRESISKDSIPDKKLPEDAFEICNLIKKKGSPDSSDDEVFDRAKTNSSGNTREKKIGNGENTNSILWNSLDRNDQNKSSQSAMIGQNNEAENKSLNPMDVLLADIGPDKMGTQKLSLHAVNSYDARSETTTPDDSLTQQSAKNDLLSSAYADKKESSKHENQLDFPSDPVKKEFLNKNMESFENENLLQLSEESDRDNESLFKTLHNKDNGDINNHGENSTNMESKDDMSSKNHIFNDVLEKNSDENWFSQNRNNTSLSDEMLSPSGLHNSSNTDKIKNINQCNMLSDSYVVDSLDSVSKNLSILNVVNSNNFSHKYSVKENECSIQSCLNQFTDLEVMDDNNLVACKVCTEREKEKSNIQKDVCTRSTKQYLISQVPAVLILHLKRFQLQRYFFRKTSKQVDFPLLLDLAPVCENPTGPKMYSLYGVVEHHGSLNSGHYVAYVKVRAPLEENNARLSFLPAKDGFKTNSSNDNDNYKNNKSSGKEITIDDIQPPPGKWYYISDSRVTEIEEEAVLRKEAYLLFYERLT